MIFPTWHGLPARERRYSVALVGTPTISARAQRPPLFDCRSLRSGLFRSEYDSTEFAEVRPNIAAYCESRAGSPCHGRRRRAFTLLELTISMAVVAVLIVLLFTSLHVGLKAREVTENAVATNRSADLVMEIIRNDIQSALPPSRGAFAQAFEGTSNPNGDGFDVLDFFTSAPASLHMVNGASVADGDIKEIVLTAYQPPGSTDHVLVRRTWNNLLDPQYQPQYQQQNLTNMDEEVLCRHVVGLTFQYYSNPLLWMPTWDSTAAQPVNALPTAVQVTLQLQSPEQNPDKTPKIVTYTRIFQLPCIGASNDAATATSGTSSGGAQ